MRSNVEIHHQFKTAFMKTNVEECKRLYIQDPSCLSAIFQPLSEAVKLNALEMVRWLLETNMDFFCSSWWLTASDYCYVVQPPSAHGDFSHSMLTVFSCCNTVEIFSLMENAARKTMPTLDVNRKIILLCEMAICLYRINRENIDAVNTILESVLEHSREGSSQKVDAAHALNAAGKLLFDEQAYDKAEQFCAMAIAIVNDENKLAFHDKKEKKLIAALFYNVMTIQQMKINTPEVNQARASQSNEVGKRFLDAEQYKKAEYCFQQSITLIDPENKIVLKEINRNLALAKVKMCIARPGNLTEMESCLSALLSRQEEIPRQEEINRDQFFIETIIKALHFFEVKMAYQLIEECCEKAIALIGQQDISSWIILNFKLTIAKINLNKTIKMETLDNILTKDALDAIKKKMNEEDDWTFITQSTEMAEKFHVKNEYSLENWCYEHAFNVIDVDSIKDSDRRDWFVDIGVKLVNTQSLLKLPTNTTVDKTLLVKKSMRSYDNDVITAWNKMGDILLEGKKYDETERCYQASFDLFYLVRSYEEEITCMPDLIQSTNKLIKVKSIQGKEYQEVLATLLQEVRKNTAAVYDADEYYAYVLMGCDFYRMDSLPSDLTQYRNSFILVTPPSIGSYNVYHVTLDGKTNKAEFNFNKLVNEYRNEKYRLSADEFRNLILSGQDLETIDADLVALGNTISAEQDPHTWEAATQCFLLAYEIALKRKDNQSIITLLKAIKEHYQRGRRKYEFIDYIFSFLFASWTRAEKKKANNFTNMLFICDEKMNEMNEMNSSIISDLHILKLSFHWIAKTYVKLHEIKGDLPDNLRPQKEFFEICNNKNRFYRIYNSLKEFLQPPSLQQIIARHPDTMIKLINEIAFLRAKVEKLESQQSNTGNAEKNESVNENAANHKKTRREEDASNDPRLFQSTKKFKPEVSPEMEVDSPVTILEKK